MRPPLVLLAALALPATAEYICDTPQSGCTNGLFSVSQCKCLCIEPFCHDAHGDCTLPTSSCGGNPWTECVRGENCPWWANPGSVEKCTTGNVVPAGIWQIYSTRRECCESSFPFISNFDNCDPTALTDSPTKHPTISRVDLDDDYEIVPLRFDIQGLPDDVKMKDLREEMLKVLKRILLRLSEKIDGLKISKVEERTSKRRLGEMLLGVAAAFHRELRDESLYYNIEVVRDPGGTRFGPRIIEEMERSYGEILEQIQTSPDLNFFQDEGMQLNFCTSENGKFTNCIFSDAPASAPSSVTINNNRPTVNQPTIIYAQPISGAGAAPTTTVGVQSDGDDGSTGMKGWAIFLIILLILVLLCCIGACVYHFCFRDRRNGGKDTEVHNNFFFDEKSEGRSRRSRAAPADDDDDDEGAIVVAHPQDPNFAASGITADTYGSGKRVKIARDPTQFIPGDENKPDPGSRSGGRQYYLEDGQDDPPLKARREPTQYVDGVRNSPYHNYFGDEAAIVPRREPTMYVGGQSVDDGASFLTGDSAPEEGMSESCPAFRPESDVDLSGRSGRSGRSYASNVDHSGRSGKSREYYESGSPVDSESIRTREPQPSVDAGRSKKSQRSKKSSRSKGGGSRR